MENIGKNFVAKVHQNSLDRRADGLSARHVIDYVTDHVVSENFTSLFSTITTYRFTNDMGSTPTNLGTQGNAGDENKEPNDERNRQKDARQARGKDKGKRKANAAELEEVEGEEEVEQRQKAMLQRCKEAFAKLEADINADMETIQAVERHRTALEECLIRLRLLPDDEVVEPMYPPIEFVQSETGSRPVRNENDPVSEAPSPRDPNEGVSQ